MNHGLSVKYTDTDMDELNIKQMSYYVILLVSKTLILIDLSYIKLK